MNEENSPNLHVRFEGLNQPDLICPNHTCRQRTPATGFERFTTLQLDIIGETSLQGALDSWLQREEPVYLNAWKCSRCGQQGNPHKQNTMTLCPNVLRVQLKRYRTHFEEGSMVPARAEYLTHHIACEEVIKIGGASYRQVARIYHQGQSIYHGHYFTIGRHDLPQGRWWYYNDTVRRLEREEDDLDMQARVYLCLYERMQ